MKNQLRIESDSPELTILVFDETDEDARRNRKRMNSSDDAYSCLWDIDQEIRRWRKYPPDEWTQEQADFAYDLQENICKILGEYNLDELL